MLVCRKEGAGQGCASAALGSVSPGREGDILVGSIFPGVHLWCEVNPSGEAEYRRLQVSSVSQLGGSVTSRGPSTARHRALS